MLGRIFCLFGFHDWEYHPKGSFIVKIDHIDGSSDSAESEIRSKRCKRCLKQSTNWDIGLLNNRTDIGN